MRSRILSLLSFQCPLTWSQRSSTKVQRRIFLTCFRLHIRLFIDTEARFSAKKPFHVQQPVPAIAGSRSGDSDGASRRVDLPHQEVREGVYEWHDCPLYLYEHQCSRAFLHLCRVRWADDNEYERIRG